MNNYPPGVTGNEPQITGEWPCDECDGRGYDEDEDGKTACLFCEGKGHITGDETYFNKRYVCPGCHGTVEYDDEMDNFKCDDDCCNDGYPSTYTYREVLWELREKATA